MAFGYGTPQAQTFDFDIGEETRRAQERARRDPRHPSNVKVKPPPPPFDIPGDFPLPPDDFPRPDQDPVPLPGPNQPEQRATGDFKDVRSGLGDVQTFGPGQGWNPYTGATSQGAQGAQGAQGVQGAQGAQDPMDQYRNIPDVTPDQEAAWSAWIAQNPGDYRRAASALGIREVPYPTDAAGNERGAPPNSQWDSVHGGWRSNAASQSDPGDPGDPDDYTPGEMESAYQVQVDAGTRDALDLRMARMIDQGTPHWERMLREWAAEAGVPYEPSDLEGVRRNLSYYSNDTGTAGGAGDPMKWLNEAKARMFRRADNTPNSDVNEGRQIGRLSPVGPATDQERRSGLSQQMLQQRGESSEARQQSIRDILMEQLGQATGPIDMSSDAMRTQLDPQRVALQRSAERQRSQMAARLAQEGLLDSGTFDTGLSGIEQQRGESEASMTGQVVGRELESRRTQVMNLLNMALRSGDAESARVLSGQLQMLDMQLRKELTLSGQQITRDQNLAGNNLQLQALMNQLAMSQLPYERVNLGTRRY